MDAVDKLLAKYGNVCDTRSEEERLRDYYWDIIDAFEGGYEVDTYLVDEAYAYFESQEQGGNELDYTEENEVFGQKDMNEEEVFGRNDRWVENQKFNHVWEEKYVDDQGKEIVLIHMPEWLLKCEDDNEKKSGKGNMEENSNRRDSSVNGKIQNKPFNVKRCISVESLPREWEIPCTTQAKMTLPDFPTQTKMHAKNRGKVKKPHTLVKSNGMPRHESVEIPPTSKLHEYAERKNVRMNTVSRVKVCSQYNLKCDKQSGKSKEWKYRRKSAISVAGEIGQRQNNGGKVKLCKNARQEEMDLVFPRCESGKSLYFAENEIVKWIGKKPIVGIG